MTTPRPSIGRWLIAVPLGLVGLLLAGFGLVSVGKVAWLGWNGKLSAGYTLFSDTSYSPLSLTGIFICWIVLGVALNGGAWLLVRRREGREG